MTTPRRIGFVLGLIVLLTVGSVHAQPNSPPEQRADEPPRLVRYRIGLACEEASEALRMHLRLPADAGLLVNRVLDGSPADRAGLQRFDVVAAADGDSVRTVSDLVQRVNEAKTSALALSVIRQGEPRTVTVTPEEAPAEEIDLTPRPQFPLGFDNRQLDGLPPGLRRYLEQFEGPGQPGFGWRGLLPPDVLNLPDTTDPPEGRRSALPDGFNLQIDKSGDGPAKIRVKRGEQEWNATEDDLDDLPDDIRPLVENMLNGSRSELSGRTVPELWDRLPRRGPSPRRVEPNPRLEKRFDGLELQLQELQDAIRSMQERQD